MTRSDKEEALVTNLINHINRYGLDGYIKKLQAITDPEYTDAAAYLVDMLKDYPEDLNNGSRS